MFRLLYWGDEPVWMNEKCSDYCTGETNRWQVEKRLVDRRILDQLNFCLKCFIHMIIFDGTGYIFYFSREIYFGRQNFRHSRIRYLMKVHTHTFCSLRRERPLRESCSVMSESWGIAAIPGPQMWGKCWMLSWRAGNSENTWERKNTRVNKKMMRNNFN